MCPLVLCNDFHHPALLAQELAAMDLLSGGRVEAGIGAGHAFLEYASIGRVMDPPAVRKARTLSEWVSHEPRWQSERLDRRVARIRQEAAGGRDPELNALVRRVRITDDRRAAARELLERYLHLDLEDILETPFVALGAHEEVADHLRGCRELWGISYFTVRDLDASRR